MRVEKYNGKLRYLCEVPEIVTISYFIVLFEQSE